LQTGSKCGKREVPSQLLYRRCCKVEQDRARSRKRLARLTDLGWHIANQRHTQTICNNVNLSARINNYSESVTPSLT
jgi:hypothetical protein